MGFRISTLVLIVFAWHFCSAQTSIYPPTAEDGPFDLENKASSNAEPGNGTMLRTSAKSRTLIPTHYQLQVRPLFDPEEKEGDRFTIPGTVTILVECDAETTKVRLDAKRITVLENRTRVRVGYGDIFPNVQIVVDMIIWKAANRQVRILSQKCNERDQSYEIALTEPLQAGEAYEITLDYVAQVFRDRLDGIYLSNYTVPGTNETRFLTTSHFEPNGARQAFPCFDEPDLKARFDISIGRRAQYNSLSNMNLIGTEPIKGLDGWYWDHYNTTVRMSTYLIAMIVSDFKSETASPVLFGGKPVKIWAPKHDIEKKGGVYAADVAAKILPFYESYFLAQYPLPKMDSVALKHFSAGAMENYGLNTYREKMLLYFEGESTEAQRYSICSVIAHELGHQWFGNYVTCRTWSQLWLNEGFAAYVQNMGANEACPEFEPWAMFVPSTLQTAYVFDQSPAAHPIVNESDSSTAKFSKITYNKGASLIRMMQGFLGEEVLKKGLQRYLSTLAFGNAHQDDLFNVLYEEGQKAGTVSNYTTLTEIMESWTLKSGYPLVRVDLGSSNKIYLSQEPFVKLSKDRNRTAAQVSKSLDLWWIPVKVATKRQPDFQNRRIDFWIPNNVGTFLRSGVDTNDWLIVNPDSVGYYRVLYDPVLTNRIQAQLNSDPSPITSATRSQLLDDYFNFGFSDYIKIERALELTTYLGKETEYNVWTSVLRHLRRPVNLLSNSPGFKSLQGYLGPKLKSALNLIGFEQSSAERGIKVLNRAQLLEWACLLQDPQCLQYAAKLVQVWIDAPTVNRIPLDIRPTIYCAAVGSGQNEDKTWNFVLQKYEEAAEGRQKEILLSALSCSKNPDRIQALLNSSLEPNSSAIRKQDTVFLLPRIAANPAGRKLIFDFIQKEAGRLVEVYKRPELVASVLLSLSAYMHEDADYTELLQFVETHGESLKSVQKSMGSVVKAVLENQAWISKYYQPLTVWFEAKGKPAIKTKIHDRVDDDELLFLV